MNPIRLLIGLHNHQPVGNFEHVFKIAYEKCYNPIIETFSKYPEVKFSLHHSGPLLEWIEKNQPDYLTRLKKLVTSGQVELLGGGFYEPILASLPEHDAVGQLNKMSDWLEEKLGQRPTGAWLAERIWDPALPKVLGQAGISFTLLDDTHFQYAGLAEGDMNGYYVTERHGYSLAVFPIDKFLRYSIPFRQPEESLSYFKKAAEKSGNSCLSYGDDGEKFGLWPETYDWVYTRKWLARFLDMLKENQTVVETSHYEEFINSHPSRGRIYLPMASYEEMMHWSLPLESAKQHTAITEEIKENQTEEKYKPFLRGGLWDNFLTKYDESNILHKKMLYASSLIEKAAEAGGNKTKIEQATKALYRGQCNCPYWHGLFGGLYLANLRYGVHKELTSAIAIAEELKFGKTKSWVTLQRHDFLKQGGKQFMLNNRQITALIDPAYGGSVALLDYKPTSFTLTNVLTRREEEYHQKIRDAATGEKAEQGEILSPHDRINMKEDGLEKKLIIDSRLRRSFIDSFYSKQPSSEELRLGTLQQICDISTTPYSATSEKSNEKKVELTLEAVATMQQKDGTQTTIKIDKTYQMSSDDKNITCQYSITNAGTNAASFIFAVEWNFTLLAADADDRYITIAGKKHKMNKQQDVEDVKSWGLSDEWSRTSLTFNSDEAVKVNIYPIETVSQSEDGFESNYQGTCFTASQPVFIKPNGVTELAFTLQLTTL